MSTYTALEDRELLQLVQEDDSLAFAEIFERYWKKLLAIGYNLTRDKHAAEEIAQEAMVSLWQRRNSVHIQTLSSYLATAVKFSVYKQYHRFQRRQELLEGMPTPSGENSLDDQAQVRFLQDYLGGIVNQLPEKCRLVFTYKRDFDMTTQDIAQKMHISEKTVEGHLTKAIRTLRNSLKIIQLSFLEILLGKSFMVD